jgi:hypothetical protein
MKKLIYHSIFAVSGLALVSCGTTNAVQKDGLSYETAVKVNSVAEEYRFIKKNCADCEPERQSLTEHDGKPFDVLTVKKPDGSKISYYFDIKSFYGKFY